MLVKLVKCECVYIYRTVATLQKPARRAHILHYEMLHTPCHIYITLRHHGIGRHIAERHREQVENGGCC